MFDCVILEYEICKLLSKSEVELHRRFWCDGVIMSEDEEHYSKKSVNDNRYVFLNAWIGEIANTRKESLYTMRLNFGPKALGRFTRNLPIEKYLSHVCTLDVKQKIIELQLL
ncbi:MAG: hypothetical protein ACK5LC_10860 [Coprobacillaceae bacterium]